MMRAVQHNPHQLAPCSHAGLIEQMLQGRLDCRLGRTDLAGNLPVGRSTKDPSEDRPFAFFQAIQAKVLVLRITVGQELDHSPIHPSLAARHQSDRLHQAGGRIRTEENA